MDTNERANILQKIDLFQSFTDEELTRFAEKVTEVSCQPDTYLFSDGEAGRDMFILLEGRLEVLKNRRVITTIVPVDYVGEMGLIEEMPRSATVKAVAPSLLFQISAELFQDVTVRADSLLAMMRVLSRRVRQDTERIALQYEKANILIHDMKNSLATFLYLDLLKRKLHGKAEQRMIEVMVKTRGDLAAMMREALANAKQIPIPPGMTLGSLPDLLLEMEDAEFPVHPDLSDREITVKVLAELPDFYFNQLEIRRVVMNLVLNGAQASLPGDPVVVSVTHEENQARVTVTDWGTGIDDTVSKTLFYAQQSTKEQGTGLGLIACRHIVEQHGGTIRCIPAEGEAGTDFSFTLPLDLTERQDEEGA